MPQQKSAALVRTLSEDRTVVGRLEQVVERLHGGAAMGLEALERWTVGAVSAARGVAAAKQGGAGGKSAARAKSSGRAKSGARKRAASR